MCTVLNEEGCSFLFLLFIEKITALFTRRYQTHPHWNKDRRGQCNDLSCTPHMQQKGEEACSALHVHCCMWVITFTEAWPIWQGEHTGRGNSAGTFTWHTPWEQFKAYKLSDSLSGYCIEAVDTTILRSYITPFFRSLFFVPTPVKQACTINYPKKGVSRK